ncbi:MAG: hypothetical protein V1799_00125 [bacterium]
MTTPLQVLCSSHSGGQRIGGRNGELLLTTTGYNGYDLFYTRLLHAMKVLIELLLILISLLIQLLRALL